MNTITIELCKEDRERLDKILAALLQGPHCDTCVQHVVEYVSGGQEEPEESEPEMMVPQVPVIGQADIQKKVVSLSVAGKKKEVREIVTQYAECVSNLPAKKLAEVWDKLSSLEIN